MSRRSGRSRSNAGGDYSSSPNRRLPSANDLLVDGLEAASLVGGLPRRGIQAEDAARVWRPAATRRHAEVLLPTPARKAPKATNSILKAPWGSLSHRLRYADPRLVLVCLRRKIRREVLFAKNIGGHKHKSPGRGGSYRRSKNSNWSC